LPSALADGQPNCKDNPGFSSIPYFRQVYLLPSALQITVRLSIAISFTYCRQVYLTDNHTAKASPGFSHIQYIISDYIFILLN